MKNPRIFNRFPKVKKKTLEMLKKQFKKFLTKTIIIYVKRLTEWAAHGSRQSARWAGSFIQSLHVHNKVYTPRPHYAKNLLFFENFKGQNHLNHFKGQNHLNISHFFVKYEPSRGPTVRAKSIYLYLLFSQQCVSRNVKKNEVLSHSADVLIIL